MQAASIPAGTDVRAPSIRRTNRATGALALADGLVVLGHGFGREGVAEGELVFNTAMTGYQEILSDPSYAGQIITFTFPHIGNTGVNDEDFETAQIASRGLVVRALTDRPSSWRQQGRLAAWCADKRIVGLSGVDTRRLTAHLRDQGAQNCAICHASDGAIDTEALLASARGFGGLGGLDLVPDVTSDAPSSWDQADWQVSTGYGRSASDGPHVVVVDYGVKSNILRMLATLNCRVTVVPGDTKAGNILGHAPDAIVLSNGPGDPAATGVYAVPEIRQLVASGTPLMGICLGHQMLGLALGATTEKMAFGHHGANHPVKDLATGKVEITSQNHGFAVADGDLPANVEVTHRSLFDGTIQGIALRDRPVYSVQYHPEASPGPVDSRYLFERLLAYIQKA